MARSAVSFVLLISVASALAAPKSLPTVWPTCKKSDPNLAGCLQKAMNDVVIPDLATKGAKDLGVFPIDPLVISAIDMLPGKGPVSLELHFNDLHITGLQNAKIGDVTADIDNYHLSAPVTISGDVILKGQYKIDGKVLVLPITGEGACEIKLEGINGHVDLIGKELVKGNDKYMEVQDFKFDFEPKRMRIKFENLFNGNKQLGDQMNNFMNENWVEVLKELKPSVQDAFGLAFGDITNRIFKKVAYNKIFA